MTDTTPSSSNRPAPTTLRAGVLDPAAMDTSVRVQDDLFRYVNGTWLATAEIPADRPGTGSFIELRDAAEDACHTILTELSASLATGGEDAPAPGSPEGKISGLFAAFMDEERVDALGASPLAEDLAGVLGASTKEELAQAIGSLITVGFTGPVAAAVENDLNNPERYTTWMGQAGLGLPDESYYREESQAGVRKDYVAHIARMLTLAGLAGSPAATSGDDAAAALPAPAYREPVLSEDASAVAAAVMDLETALAKGHWDRVACRDIEKINNPRSWQEATASAPSFPWQAWREGITQAARQAGADTGEFLEHLVLEQPDYLPHAASVWQKTDLEVLRAWAAWHVVSARASLLSRELSEESFRFYSQRLQGVAEQRARWKRGVGLVESCLGEALGQIYVARHFPPSHKAAMEALVTDLIEAYRQSISSLEWMGPDTRERALDKLALFTPKIGYPEAWRDYSAVTVDAGDLLGSVRSVERYELARDLTKLAGPVDRGEWHMTPQTVNAYYNPTMNEIVFPAAILQPPFFDPQADAAVNYAGIGAVIGHEIGHGFDDQGSTFDGTGKVSDWWTAEDRTAFTERTKALIAQYDAFQPAELLAAAQAAGKDASEVPHVNGALTIGENIGDLGGLGIALKAYRLALAREGIESVEQAPVIDGVGALERFFYSWARIWRGKNRNERAELLLTIDPHSPSEFRCNGIVRNMDAFYEAFGVREGDGLWLAPEERVTIW